MLNSVKDLRSKSIILFLSASGVRRGAIPELKIKHLKEMSNDCLAVTVYEGSDEEYITFIHKEAKEILTLYFEQRKHDGESFELEHPVFRSKYTLGIAKPKPISEKSISNMVHRTKKNAGVNFDDTPNLLCHAFRRRFNTILKLRENAKAPIIERLMGHDMKLDNSYFQPTLDDLFQEYRKGIPDLVIDDKERILEEKKIVENEKNKLEETHIAKNEVQKMISNTVKQEIRKMLLKKSNS